MRVEGAKFLMNTNYVPAQSRRVRMAELLIVPVGRQLVEATGELAEVHDGLSPN